MKKANAERAVRAGFKQGVWAVAERLGYDKDFVNITLEKIDAKSDPYYEREINLIVLSLSSEKGAGDAES